MQVWKVWGITLAILVAGYAAGRASASPVKVPEALQAPADETLAYGRNGAFSRIASVQRVATAGGVAPPHGCPYAGFRVEIPYTADYYLFTKK